VSFEVSNLITGCRTNLRGSELLNTPRVSDFPGALSSSYSAAGADSLGVVEQSELLPGDRMRTSILTPNREPDLPERNDPYSVSRDSCLMMCTR
jgi:hypothetical protein